MQFSGNVRALRRFGAAVVLAVVGCQLVSCGQTSSSDTATGSALKVALLTPGDINDQGWNQLAYEGLQAVEKELGVKTAHQVTKTKGEQQAALRELADQKYDLVICHGFEFGTIAKEIAPQYKGTKFAIVAGDVKQEPNVATLVPKLEEATYLVGMTAGGMTRSNVVGAIGGMELPVIRSTFEAFEAGAKAANPKVRVLPNYVGNFEDQNKAKEIAKLMIAQKADFLFHNADQAGKGMFNAAQGARGVYVFGSNRNQNDITPEICLSSAVIELPHAFVQLVRDVQEGNFKAEFRELNLKNGGIAVEWNDDLKSKVPADLMKKIEAAEERIKEGELTIKRNV